MKDFSYEEKDLLKTLTTTLRSALNDLVLHSEGGVHLVANEVTVAGEAFASAASGTRYKGTAHHAVVFNLRVEVKFYGRIMVGGSTIGAAGGEITLAEVSYDVLDAPETWEFRTKLDAEGIPAMMRPEESPSPLSEVDERIKACAGREGTERVRGVLLKILRDLVHGREGNPATGDAAAGEADEAAPSVRTSLTKDLRRMMLGKSFLSVIAGEMACEPEWRLGICTIGDDEIAELVEPLKANQALLRLDLSMNKIGDSGMATLCEALQVHLSLRELDLRRNAIGNAGVQALVATLAMGGAPELRSVKLAHNDAIDETGRTIASGLAFMRKDVTIDFDEPGLLAAADVVSQQRQQ